MPNTTFVSALFAWLWLVQVQAVPVGSVAAYVRSEAAPQLPFGRLQRALMSPWGTPPVTSHQPVSLRLHSIRHHSPGLATPPVNPAQLYLPRPRAASCSRSILWQMVPQVLLEARQPTSAASPPSPRRVTRSQRDEAGQAGRAFHEPMPAGPDPTYTACMWDPAGPTHTA